MPAPIAEAADAAGIRRRDPLAQGDPRVQARRGAAASAERNARSRARCAEQLQLAALARVGSPARPNARLGEAILRVHDAKTAPPFSPFPEPDPPECAARVDDFGRRMYGALGIDRADAAARWRQTGRNYLFFEAPVGFIVTIKAAMTRHSWLDCGVFVQTLMLAAQVRGLATCPQVSFVRYQPVIAQELALAEDELVTCGISCGYADEHAAVNRMEMPREPVDGFTRWLGFDG